MYIMTNLTPEILNMFKGVVFSKSSNRIRANVASYRYTLLQANKEVLLSKKKNRQELNYLGTLRGEIYQAYCFELFLKFANNKSYITQVLMKGPYVSENNESTECLIYNRYGDITYSHKSESLAEFDILFKYKSQWVWIEITRARSGKGDLLRNIQRKRKILEEIFNQKSIVCILIRPKKYKVAKIEWLVQIAVPYPKHIEKWIIRYNDPQMIQSILKSKKQLFLPLKTFQKPNLDEINLQLRKDFLDTSKGRLTSYQFLDKHNSHIRLVKTVFLGMYALDLKEEIINLVENPKQQVLIRSHQTFRISIGVSFESGMNPRIRVFLINKIDDFLVTSLGIEFDDNITIEIEQFQIDTEAYQSSKFLLINQTALLSLIEFSKTIRFDTKEPIVEKNEILVTNRQVLTS